MGSGVGGRENFSAVAGHSHDAIALSVSLLAFCCRCLYAIAGSPVWTCDKRSAK